jgi:hypothetical protein
MWVHTSEMQYTQGEFKDYVGNNMFHDRLLGAKAVEMLLKLVFQPTLPGRMVRY